MSFLDDLRAIEEALRGGPAPRGVPPAAPRPAPAPPPFAGVMPDPTALRAMLLDHEDRLRSLERAVGIGGVPVFPRNPPRVF